MINRGFDKKKFFFLEVFEETEPCERREIERSHKGKWRFILCLRVHEGEFVSINERQVNIISIFIPNFKEKLLNFLIIN